MQYWCFKCEDEFEAQEARCPKCLRKSTVVPEDQRAQNRSIARKGTADDQGGLWKGPGLLVAIAIIVPLTTLNMLSWHLPWFFTFIVAIIGFGAGHTANAIWRSRGG